MQPSNRIYHVDALEGLKKLADNSVDLVITDPPYNIASPSRRTFRKGKPVSTMKTMGAWDCFHPFDYDVFIMRILSECFRVLKPGGALYLFSARQDSGFFVRKAVERGFTYRNQLIAIKKNPMPSLHKRNWRNAFEICLYVSKGTPRTFNFLSQHECVNVLAYSNAQLHTAHPTEKPLSAIELLVKVSSRPGDLVLDPFMGSGTTAAACKKLGRNSLGFELNAKYVAMARQRLRRIKRPEHPTSGTRAAA